MEPVLGVRSGTAYGEDWVRTSCSICMNRCGILAHVNDDEVVDKILGDPANPHNHGRTCAKGDSGFEGLTDPDRITTPLKRTNPKRGIGEDPQWVQISWDEALDTIAERIRDTIADDPEKILYTSFDNFHLRGALSASWVTGMGMPGYSTWSAAIFCGNNVHGIAYMNQNAFEGAPDPGYSNYILNFGSQYGSVIHYDTMNATHEISQRRSDVKLISIDPVCSSAASTSDEWVPIRPGTDAALILGMVDQLINELDIYDADFLRNFTNAAYLVGPDGRYVCEAGGEKPLVWDRHNG
ncbi:MAG: molybdopterin-dependent oxidoreductase, partial [Acidimicrobiales bacterium]|nr:molybdopterin-dependent oxidoreductase [Acidimicrobiales bacterium]